MINDVNTLMDATRTAVFNSNDANINMNNILTNSAAAAGAAAATSVVDDVSIIVNENKYDEDENDIAIDTMQMFAKCDEVERKFVNEITAKFPLLNNVTIFGFPISTQYRGRVIENYRQINSISIQNLQQLPLHCRTHSTAATIRFPVKVTFKNSTFAFPFSTTEERSTNEHKHLKFPLKFVDNSLNKFPTFNSEAFAEYFITQLLQLPKVYLNIASFPIINAVQCGHSPISPTHFPVKEDVQQMRHTFPSQYAKRSNAEINLSKFENNIFIQQIDDDIKIIQENSAKFSIDNEKNTEILATQTMTQFENIAMFNYNNNNNKNNINENDNNNNEEAQQQIQVQNAQVQEKFNTETQNLPTKNYNGCVQQQSAHDDVVIMPATNFANTKISQQQQKQYLEQKQNNKNEEEKFGHILRATKEDHDAIIEEEKSKFYLLFSEKFINNSGQQKQQHMSMLRTSPLSKILEDQETATATTTPTMMMMMIPTVNTSNEILNHQKPQLKSCSDVRDTSSQEVIAFITEQCPQQTFTNEKYLNLDLLPNYYVLEQVEVENEYIQPGSDKSTTLISDLLLNRVEKIQNALTVCHKNPLIKDIALFDVAHTVNSSDYVYPECTDMTIAKVEDIEEEGEEQSSVSSLVLNNNNNIKDIEQFADSSNEMKLEMKSVKGGSATLSSSPMTRTHLLNRNESNVPTVDRHHRSSILYVNDKLPNPSAHIHLKNDTILPSTENKRYSTLSSSSSSSPLSSTLLYGNNANSSLSGSSVRTHFRNDKKVPNTERNHSIATSGSNITSMPSTVAHVQAKNEQNLSNFEHSTMRLPSSKYANSVNKLTAGAMSRTNSIGDDKVSAPSVEVKRLPAAIYNNTSVLSNSSELPKLGAIREVTSRPTSEFDPLESVLPERTRLRRQRRMLSQDKPEVQPEESTAEKLNRLRERISGALSEVKGVLKQYSTDTDGDTQQSVISSLQSSISLSPRRNIEPLQKDEAKNISKQCSTEAANPTPNSAAENLNKINTKMNGEAQQPEESAMEIAKKADDVPVQFRFVKKVRRRSIFSDDNDDKEKETTTEAVKLDEQIKGEKLSQAVPTETVEVRAEKEFQKFAESKVTKNNIVDPENGDQSKKSVTELNIKEVQPQSETIKEKEVNKEVKAKRKLLVRTKSDVRRASIAAVEKSKIEPTIDVSHSIKAQRRPSDSEAVVKKSNKINDACENIHPAAKMSSTNKLKSSKTVIQPPIAVEKNQMTNSLPQVTVSDPIVQGKIEAIENAAIIKVVDTQVNDTQKAPIVDKKSQEIMSSHDEVEKRDECVIEDIVPKSVDISPKKSTAKQQESKSKVIMKPKRNLSLKAKSDVRRASIAAVEQSQIEPPIKALAPLGIAKQRRPSDSETIIKKNSVTKKITSGVVKDAAPLLTNNSITSADINQTLNDRKVNEKLLPVVASNQNKIAVPTAAAATDTTAAMTKSSLPTQLIVDDTTITTTTKDNISEAKSVGLNNVVAAPLVSPLRTIEENSRANANAKQLNELVGETIVVVAAAKTAINKIPPILSEEKNTNKCEVIQDNEKIESSITEARAGEQKNNVEIVKSAQTLNETVADTEKPINYKNIPVETTANKQVSASTLNIAEVTAAQQHHIDKTSSVRADKTEETPKAEADLQNKDNGAVATSNSTENATTNSVVIVEEITEVFAVPEPRAEAVNMPERQAVPAPVKIPKEDVSGKKVILRKLIRKNSIDKALSTSKKVELKSSPKLEKNAEKAEKSTANTTEPEVPQPVDDATTAELLPITDAADEMAKAEMPPPPPKKTRKIKKKVIIKRQQRKLSISDVSFFKGANEEQQTQTSQPDAHGVETLEKAIAYVTDDEDEQEVEKEEKPLKPCIRAREYQPGDWVMYAERYKKTQVRWKKGQVIERITSISYKLDIDGKEVPAHISYIKKYTERKVNFGGKEYLEIDYEQIAVEEERARTYSIWNMV